MKIPRLLLVILSSFLLTGTACTSTSLPVSVNKAELQNQLPPVKAVLHRGLYVVPGCGEYGRKYPPQFPILSIPTAQEAVLAGYRPSPVCTGTAERLRIERERFGEISVSEKTENWKAQLYLAKQIEDIDSSQSKTEERQRELEEEIEQVDDKKIDK